MTGATGIREMADILAAEPLFAGLDRSVIDLLAGCAQNVHLPAGAYLAHCDDPADAFFLLRAGDVAVELGMPGRDRLTVQTLHPGQVVGASWILPPHCWRFDARAASEVRATKVNTACLREKCEADPSVGYEVMKRFLPIIAERLQSTRLRLLDLYAPPADVGRAL